MALRLMTVAFRRRAPLLAVPRAMIARPPMVRTYFVRKNLTPFFDRPSIIFSKDAVMHHWGAIPIIVITIIGTIAEIVAWIVIACTRPDVYYTKNAARMDHLETRTGVWYHPPAPGKWRTINQKWDMPRGVILGRQGDTAGPSFPEKSDKDKKSSDGPASAALVAGHVAASAVALGLAAALA
ncbi:uncharacterized protein ymp isoform X1 [Drosophila bipectinata]|uniref:uncharacterized protein ymp isoform X1 n=2 Tax=Drosophila bipectinata TaxID=42026 RepID=UPI001C8A2C0B|nr:uncharacterized protein LOC108130473 isoform X2 [Drosophila bipectinata]